VGCFVREEMKLHDVSSSDEDAPDVALIRKVRKERNR